MEKRAKKTEIHVQEEIWKSIAACPIKVIIYKRPDSLVIIDPEKHTGCKACVNAYHYNSIYINEDLNIAQKCTSWRD